MESERPRPGGDRPSLRGADGRAGRTVGQLFASRGNGWVLSPVEAGGKRVGRLGRDLLWGLKGLGAGDCQAEPFQGWFCLLLGPQRLVSASCHSGAQHQKVLRGQNREPS